jgi:hypothetical protein
MKKTALIISIMALMLVSGEAQFSCWRVTPPDHDWRVTVGTYRYGLRGYGSSTTLVSGMQSITVPLPFYGVVGITGAVACAGCFGVILIWRRGHEHRAAS